MATQTYTPMWERESLLDEALRNHLSEDIVSTTGAQIDDDLRTALGLLDKALLMMPNFSKGSLRDEWKREATEFLESFGTYCVEDDYDPLPLSW